MSKNLDLTNAKKELLELVGDKIIKCATITYGTTYDEESIKKLNLKTNHSERKYVDFLDELDFAYDAGYGGQKLFGTIWFTDSTWAERGEYDGSEWWEHRTVPAIPKNLLTKSKIS